jgi:hypothetical protein
MTVNDSFVAVNKVFEVSSRYCDIQLAACLFGS